MVFPSGPYVTAKVVTCGGGRGIGVGSPGDRFQRRTLAASHPVRKVSPRGPKAAAVTAPGLATGAPRGRPVARSHKREYPSWAPVRITRPAGPNAAVWTLSCRFHRGPT